MIIEHGSWSLSTPSGMPPAQQRILRARRDDTGMDWYEFVALKPFGDGSVVMTVGPTGTGEFMIQAATWDPTAIFPPGMRVIEETIYSGNDPFGDFHGRIYDSGRIGDVFVPPPLPPTPIETELRNRLAALEAKMGL